MTVEGVIAAFSAVTALVVALTALAVQLRMLRKEIDGRMQELIDVGQRAAAKTGELEGRDFMRRLQNPPPEDQ